MKTTSLHIAFAALLSLLSFASCSRNDEVAVAEGEEGKVQVTFTLKLDNESSASRAMSRAEDNTWGDEYNDDPGNDYDNRINDLQVVIYEGNTFKCKVTNLSFYKNEEKNEYTYLGSISETLTANTVYKIMVFANCADITSETDLSALSYTYSENMDIPMWGVLKSQFTFAAGKRTDIGSIDLLRAMAKVEVNFAESFPSNYEIGSITINPYNTQGYCLPAGYASVDVTGKLDREETIPASFNPLDSPSNMELIFKGENNSYYIYLPEYDNSTKPAKIQVTVNDKPYDLEFKDYENGAPKEGTQYDIVRNHIYRYTITGVNDGKLKLEYRVLLWDKVESAIGWNPILQKADKSPVAAWRLATAEGYTDTDVENEVKGSLCIDPDFKNAKRGDEEAVFCYVLYPRYNSDKDKQGHALHQGLEDNQSYAGFYFYLKEPEGAIWEAVLTNTEDFALNENGRHDIDGDGEDDKKCAVRGIARSEAYQIQVYPLHPWTDTEFQKDENGNIVDGAECANTYWGNLWETSGKCKNLYTDLYIRISIDGGHTWNYLDINPKDRYGIAYDGVDGYIEHTYWGERRFAGGDDENGGSYIRIWQLEAKYNKAYDKLVEDLDASWGIKDFWDPYDKLSE